MKIHEYSACNTLDSYIGSEFCNPAYPYAMIDDEELAALHQTSLSGGYAQLPKSFYMQNPPARWIRESEPPNFMPSILDRLTEQVQGGEVHVLDAITFACELGYVAIGGVKSKWLYNPADFEAPKTRYKTEDGTWKEYCEPEFEPGKVRALVSAGAAALGAMFGDPLNRTADNRRAGLAELDLPVDRPPFGWTIPWPPTDVKLNVCHELQNFAMREQLRGSVDLLWGSEFRNENFVAVTSSRAHVTRATFPISWRDLPFNIATDPVILDSAGMDDARWRAHIIATGGLEYKISTSVS